MTQVRVIADLVVEKGDTDEIVEALDEHLKSVLGFTADTILVEAVGDGIKVAKVGAEVHHHDFSSGYCMKCVAQAEKMAPPTR